MIANKELPRPNGDIFLTDAGIETYMMYKKGFELPNFSLFHLLNDEAATREIREYYRKLAGVAVKHEAGFIFCGLHYRASRDWGELLGYTRDSLAEINHRAVDLYRDIAADCENESSPMLISGCIGPRGDAYKLNKPMTVEGAGQYHAEQIETLKDAGVDFVTALTFNNTTEAIGCVRAARSLGVPVVVSFTLNASGRLKNGNSLKEAVETVDVETASAPEYYMINCTHPLDFEPALEPGDCSERLNGVRPNASSLEQGLLCQLGHLEEGDPIELSRQLADVARRFPHISVWGGCCGTEFCPHR
jgi:homocysteine S-methyltransferase